MLQTDNNSTRDDGVVGPARLAETLGLEIAAADLAALSQQLRRLDALERDALQDYPPILKMDAGWHD